MRYGEQKSKSGLYTSENISRYEINQNSETHVTNSLINGSETSFLLSSQESTQQSDDVTLKPKSPSALELSEIHSKINNLEKITGTSNFLSHLEELVSQLEKSKNFCGDQRENYLLNAEQHAYNAWKILNRKEKYQSHALNMIFTVLRNNDLKAAEKEIIDLLIGLSKNVLSSELDHFLIDESIMRFFTKKFVKNNIKLAVY